jgi:tetratricopeptide (TPR) repeat protein
MKRIWHVAVCLAILAALGARPAVEQSQDSRALKWLEIGIREKNLEKKIEAYIKAVEIDSFLVEALFNLGVAYKQQKDYAKAEEFLMRAYSARSEDVTADLRLAILYELAATQNRLGQHKRYEETLRQAKKIAADEKKAATIAFELGRFLYQQERWQDALTELQEGRRLYPSRSDDFTNLIQLAENALERQRLYAAAEQAQASGDLQKARSFLQAIVAGKLRDEKVSAKIADLDVALDQKAQEQSDAERKDQLQGRTGEENLAMSSAAVEDALPHARSDRNTGEELQKEPERDEQRQRLEAIESEYAAGQASLEARDWTNAAGSFEKVLEADANFPGARRRLQEALRNLERERTEATIAQYYADGISAMNSQDFSGALAAFDKVRAINPNYRDVANLLAEIASALEQKARSAEASSRVTVNLDSLYRQALAFQAKGDQQQAAIAFEKLQILQPNYRDVVDRLAVVRTNLNKAQSLQRTPASRTGDHSLLLQGVGVALVIVLAWLGLMIFSPGVRARYYLFRGDYAAAVEIYEKSLDRHPKRVKLYAALANLYLMLGRRDERALEVYKMALRLNMAMEKREEMNSIVAHNYLSEGRTDSEAIQVLESELQGRRGKQHRHDKRQRI